MRKKYYAVAVGRKPGLYKTWDECKAQTDGFSGSKFKSFSSENEAKKYLRLNNVGLSNDSKQRKRVDKVCLLCSKPTKAKTEVCQSCTRNKKKLAERLSEYSGREVKHTSNKILIFLKQRYDADDIFALIEEHPGMYFEARGVPREIRNKVKRDYKKHVRETEEYDVEEKIPNFVYSMLGPTKEPIKVYGERKNPFILYKCKRCGETLFTKYRDYLMSSGHDCDGIKSSGEIIVEEFLRKNSIPYKTQRDTLRCVNPNTGHVMPYDFELTGKKVLIEVQGEQHRSFIPRFHVTQEGYEYQRKKDTYKRRFAEQKGYRLIEIWYDEIENDSFKQKIRDALNI